MFKKWVVRKADNFFLRGGAIEPSVEDTSTEVLVEIPDSIIVDVSNHRYDAASFVRDATAEERQAQLAAQREREFDEARLAKAAVRALWEQIPAGPLKLTWQQTLERIKALYKQSS